MAAVVDLSLPVEECAAALYKACTTSGFAVLINHGVPQVGGCRRAHSVCLCVDVAPTDSLVADVAVAVEVPDVVAVVC